MLGLALVVGFLLHRSLFGFRLMAIGGNPVAAKLARLPVRRYKSLAFILCGVLAAIAGHSRFLVHPDEPTRYRAVADLPGLRGCHHRRREPERRQGNGHRHARRRAAARGASDRPRAALARTACAADFPRRRHDRRGRARPRCSPTCARAGLHERPPTGIRLRGLTKRYGSTVALDGARSRHCAGRDPRRRGAERRGQITLVRIIGGRGTRRPRGELTLRRPALVADRGWTRRRRRASGTAAVP